MAVTGLSLVGFLVVHLAGNLTLYQDGDTFNAYATKLESYGVGLHAVEIGLLAVFAVHIVLALRLARENSAARSTRYRVRAGEGRRTAGSSTMVVTGLALGLFLVVHVTDFRIPKLAGEIDDLAGAVRARLATALGATIYLVGAGALGLHLSHGVSSALHTLGAHHPRWSPLLRAAGRAIAVILALGFASFPIYFLFAGGAS